VELYINKPELNGYELEDQEATYIAKCMSTFTHLCILICLCTQVTPAAKLSDNINKLCSLVTPI